MKIFTNIRSVVADCLYNVTQKYTYQYKVNRIMVCTQYFLKDSNEVTVLLTERRKDN